MIKEIIVTMRPKQWYKNLILFVDIVFSMNLNVQMWLNVIAAFAIFCMLSGSEYIINEYYRHREGPEASDETQKTNCIR